ncbi:MAG: NAD(P)/FAD-dependent oxidoreductase [Rhodanobacteraceae bacterium]
MSSDVLIVGGGLAGLTLALQLRERCPDLSIRVLERRAGEAPPAAFKVGESTVEIGADYLADTLGLRAHLDDAQVRKFGFRFFFSDGHARLDEAPELGISRVFPTPSWQLERGSFENFLMARVHERGIAVEQGICVRSIELGHDGATHVVHASDRAWHACWLIDASGRAGLLRRKLDLGEDNGHHIGAAWFRVDARLSIDDWCDNPAWRGLCKPQERWRSTNHLCGSGYWVWLIPLASGAHSVGIVADTAQHPIETLNTFERALAWLRIHQPALADKLDDPRAAPLDFRFLRGVSYGCRQVFSADRWALTGEAGMFLDPFYSPGTDFIAIANTYITELVARDLAGDAIAQPARHFQQLFFSFYRNVLQLYRGQYALFGDARVMTAKVLWDYAYYWGVLCPLAIGDRLTDFALFAELSKEFAAAEALNVHMQRFFRAWHQADPAGPVPAWMDQQDLGWFAQLNSRLGEALDDRMIRVRLRGNIGLLHSLAGAITEAAMRGAPGLQAGPPPVHAHVQLLPALFAEVA